MTSKKRAFSAGLIACMLAASSVVASAVGIGVEESSDISGYPSKSSAGVASCSSERIATASDIVGVEAGETIDYSSYKAVEAKTRRISDGVYEVLDEKGKVIATYGTTEKGVVQQKRAGWSINWTVRPGMQTAGNSRIESYDGLVFDYDIDFSRTGSSMIGFAAHDEPMIYFIETSSDGFYGWFSIDDDYGKVSLAIINNSGNTITYKGTYYI